MLLRFNRLPTRGIAAQMKWFARLIVPLGIAAASAIGCWLSVSDVEIAGEAFWANIKSASGLAKNPPLREVAHQLPYDQARFWLDELLIGRPSFWRQKRTIRITLFTHC
jgi:hypothetical protein